MIIPLVPAAHGNEPGSGKTVVPVPGSVIGPRGEWGCCGRPPWGGGGGVDWPSEVGGGGGGGGQPLK